MVTKVLKGNPKQHVRLDAHDCITAPTLGNRHATVQEDGVRMPLTLSSFTI